METTQFIFDYTQLDITIKDIIEICPDETAGIEDFTDILQEIIDEGKEFISARGGYNIFESFNCADESMMINEINFNTGKIITRQMQKAEKIVVFACTAGPGVRVIYDKYMKEGDPLKAFFVDTLGTVAVEKAMDIIHESIRHEAEKQGLHCTNRYSPGYCGWLVKEQQNLWKFLPENFCGISLTPSSLMLPIKSVSGIIGLGTHTRKNPYSCSVCDLDHCIYRRKKVTKKTGN